MSNAAVCSQSAGVECLRQLDSRIAEVVAEVKCSDVWKAIASPDSTDELVRAVLREVYWEIHSYQPATTKAGFSWIGGSKPADQKLMRTLLLHKWEEVEHRVWALDGYRALGGEVDAVRSQCGMSPGAFAVAAVWERLAANLPPLAYLGAEYLFEDLTALLTAELSPILTARNLVAEGIRFVVDHATEDEKHSDLLKKLVVEVVDRYPELQSDVLFAFDCFRYVYPLPLWMDSYERARQSISIPLPKQFK